MDESTPPRPLSLEAEAALFALHLAGGTSYYKTCCPKEIEVQSGKLNADQAAFWNTVYERGLGEFFYQNQIDFRKLIQFPITNHPFDKLRVNQSPITNHQFKIQIFGI